MSNVFSQEEIAILAPYVTSVDRPIYALKDLPEEVVAVLFAYYSRSRQSLRRNLLTLIQERDIDLAARLNTSSLEAAELTIAREKARQFHEKWVVGYGHASVAEHAVVHLAIEMERASLAYNRIAEEYPLEAQYVLPLAYRVRVLFTSNLRELFHFIQLHSARQGHFSYRRIAQQVYAEIERAHPALARYIRVDQADYQLGRL